MRVIIFATILSQVICLPSQDLNHIDIEKYDHLIWDYLEYYLRNFMRTKNPVLDPYKEENQNTIQFNDTKFLVKSNFSDLHINNLSNYDVMYCNGDHEENIIFGLSFPTLTINGSYDVNLRHLENDIIGKGQYNLTITDLRVLSKAQISSRTYLKRNGIYFKSLALKIIPGIFKLSATNIYLDSKKESNKWSKKVSKLMPMMIFDSHEIIEPYLSQIFLTYLNK
ncbi:uncharacterized protein LOC123260667 [Cotesia glomerata]|uniref:Uncharacterized protein n=1 Tax=Cotesia glomerata TaxID=32391 RepID=A0AAV7IGD8_COTGL|nr:uncharacterized protein LOC123260667 [Cotesia glomerata]XP_044577840.1 uncharacterized protein LOC123260667 [Cotesia glomerata]XP_044577841.1 uncharacterized protein LOC123260667 [Cotesia glomerata]XP_044577842.1 uncharacterized protein LOC123260667 [Cotesia glomerata]XP_044577843.1 uncharacterized protein LOC123260667 [Cotesia glomerata]KAH0549459.1 hypothetical protein KQX54_009454 [Cotesia glomerata]